MTQYFEQGEAGAAEQALQDYLDALLHPAPAVPPVRPAAPAPVAPLPLPVLVHSESRPFAEPVKPLPLRMPLPALAPGREASAAVERRAVPIVEPAVETPPVEEVRVEAPAPVREPTIETAPPVIVVEPVPVPAPAAPVRETAETEDALRPADWLANGRPHWAQQSFECLLFNVGGLRLAVPLVELGSIYPLEAGSLTPIFGQADWFMGLLPTKERNIRVIDAAQVVMPERYRPELRDGYRYVITLDGSDWGLAADSVADALMLDPEAVRWRSERSKRPWLAGTVVGQMCALIDAAQLNWLFHRQDRRRHDGRGAP